MMSLKELFRKPGTLLTLMAIAFYLPLAIYPKLVSLLIAVLIVFWFLEEKPGNKWYRIYSHPFVYLFIAFYLMHVVAMFYTTETPVGHKDLEIKTAIWLLPLLLSGLMRTVKLEINAILQAFVTGTFLATIICIIYALVNPNQLPDSRFYYATLSHILHPSYFALYINICIGYLMFALLNEHTYTKGMLFYIRIFLIVYFSLFTYLLSSKAGIIGTSLALTIPLIIQIIQQKKKLINYLFLAAAIIFSIFLITKNPRFESVQTGKQRIEAGKQTGESNAVRILIWKSTIDVIKEHPIMGVGTGDIKYELSTKYEENNIKSALEKQLNVHNQFLETWLGQGLIGILLLLGIFIYGSYISIRSGDYLLFLFLVITALHFSVESMLNTQAGVIFFVFMYSVLLLRTENLRN